MGGKNDRRRVSARLSDEMKELTNDLVSLPVRSRGPRLLWLAGIGLAVLHGNGALLTVPGGMILPDAAKASTPSRRKRLPPGMAGNLLNSAAKLSHVP